MDKFRQNLALREAGLCVPATRRPGEMWHGDVSRAKKFVVKPVDLRGGRGVLMLDGTQFEDAQRVRRSMAQAMSAGGSGVLIQQEWIEGPQYSTESIVKDGKAIFTAMALRNYARLEEFAPYVIEDGSDVDGELGTGKLGIGKLVEEACAALGWDNCTVKGDMVLRDGEWNIIELAARCCCIGTRSRFGSGILITGCAALLSLRPSGSTPPRKLNSFIVRRPL